MDRTTAGNWYAVFHEPTGSWMVVTDRDRRPGRNVPDHVVVTILAAWMSHGDSSYEQRGVEERANAKLIAQAKEMRNCLMELVVATPLSREQILDLKSKAQSLLKQIEQGETKDLTSGTRPRN